jgi:hypothetical protein
MKRLLPNRREAALWFVVALTLGLLGLAFAAVGSGPLWQRGEAVLLAVMALLGALLLLKAVVVFVSVGLGLLLSRAE